MNYWNARHVDWKQKLHKMKQRYIKNIEEVDKQKKRCETNRKYRLSNIITLYGGTIYDSAVWGRREALYLAQQQYMYRVDTKDMDALTFRTPILGIWHSHQDLVEVLVIVPWLKRYIMKRPYMDYKYHIINLLIYVYY